MPTSIAPVAGARARSYPPLRSPPEPDATWPRSSCQAGVSRVSSYSSVSMLPSVASCVLLRLLVMPCAIIGQRLLVSGGGDRTIRCWSVDAGAVAAGGPQQRVSHGHADDVQTVGFSPDGRLLVSSSLAHTARLWSVERGQETLVLSGHSASLSAAAFSFDNSVRLWEVATGRSIDGWCGISAGGRVVAFTRAGICWLTASTRSPWCCATCAPEL